MEPDESKPRISATVAAESLAAVAEVRGKVRRADYPVWFWLGAGAALVMLVVYMLVPVAEPWPTVLSLATVALAGVTAIAFQRVRRVRGACGSATAWWEMLSLVPVVGVLVVAGLLHRFGPWQDPLAGLLTAAVAGVVFVVAGLAISNRPARR